MHFLPLWDPACGCPDTVSQPKAAENLDTVLRAGAGMLLSGFKAGGGLALLCGHHMYVTLDMPMVLEGDWLPLGSSQCWALPAHCWVFKSGILPNPGIMQSTLCLLESPPWSLIGPPHQLSLMSALGLHHSSNLPHPKKEAISKGVDPKGASLGKTQVWLLST